MAHLPSQHLKGSLSYIVSERRGTAFLLPPTEPPPPKEIVVSNENMKGNTEVLRPLKHRLVAQKFLILKITYTEPLESHQAITFKSPDSGIISGVQIMTF